MNIRTFMSGVIALLPIAATLAIVAWAGGFIYSYFGPGSAIGRVLTSLGLGLVGSPLVAYLVGLVIIATLIYGLGVVVESSLQPRLYGRLDAMMQRIPLVGMVYDLSKRFVKNAVYAGTIITHYRTQHANFQQPTPWPFPCTAGETTAVIDYNGDVRACELREKFASLGDFDYDFGALWEANERQLELAQIDGGKACWCTHVCFIHDSMRHSRRSLLYEIPRNYLTRESW